MSRQHTPPHVVTPHGQTLRLAEATGLWSEDHLQQLLHAHPELLPVEQVEPAFGPLIPIAREVGLASGRLDLLLMNPDGLLTLVECKLWKNEEARRSVVGQLLEYANDTTQLTYTDLEAAIRRARNEPDFNLFSYVQDHTEALDEASFVDDVNRNLQRGRFLLLIVGDGIRERTESVAEYLQTHAHLNFTFSLVQIALHHLPQDGGVLVQPRILMRTIEVERAVVRLEGDRLTGRPAPRVDDRNAAPLRSQRRTVSLQVFLEQLAETDAAVAERLDAFLTRATQLGLDVDEGRGTIMLKLDPDDRQINFGIFRTNGTFENKGMADRAEINGDPIGMRYLEELARLVGGTVRANGGPFHWAIRNEDGSRVRIERVLNHEDAWLHLIERTIRDIQRASEA